MAAEAAVSSELQRKHDKVIDAHLLVIYSSLRNYRAYDIEDPALDEENRVMRTAFTDNESNVLLSISILAETIGYAKHLITALGRSNGGCSIIWLHGLLKQAGWILGQDSVRSNERQLSQH